MSRLAASLRLPPQGGIRSSTRSPCTRHRVAPRTARRAPDRLDPGAVPRGDGCSHRPGQQPGAVHRGRAASRCPPQHQEPDVEEIEPRDTIGKLLPAPGGAGAPCRRNRQPPRCPGADPSSSAATAARTRCSSRAEPTSRSRGVRLTAVARSSKARFCSSAPRRSTGLRSPAAPSHAWSASSTRPQSGFLCSRTSAAACAVSASRASASRSASGTKRLSACGTWLSMTIAARSNPLSASSASSASRDVRPLGRTGSCRACS